MRFPELNRFLTGIAVPVFSLRTRLSCGTGEFLDLVPFARWSQKTGFDLVQILPVSDSGDTPSPYSAQSAFALHPIYTRLDALPGAAAYAKEIEEARRRFEAEPRLRYADVLLFKRYIIERCFTDGFRKIQHDAAFRSWIAINPWLKPYCVYKHLKRQRPGQSWTAWPERPIDVIEELWREPDREVLLHAWTQYQLEQQLRRAASLMAEMGIFLKGDLPILVSEDSADVWANHHLFNLDERAGAPPDMFSPEGQNWNFPTFRWDAMKATSHVWWKARLKQASKFYHAFRIDHVLGFFRIWCIPAGTGSARLGYFSPAVPITTAELDQLGVDSERLQELVDGHAMVRTPDGWAPAWYHGGSVAFEALPVTVRERVQARIEQYLTGQEAGWRTHGTELLRMIQSSTNMMICAEDLGIVPECVPEVLEDLGILGLRVERWTGHGSEFADPADFPRLTVASPSTHDTSTLRGWWEELTPETRQKYFERLGQSGNCPGHLSTELSRAILERNLGANSRITVLTLQDILGVYNNLRTWNPDEERINRPGTESELNWSYRMRLPVESLAAYEEFNRDVYSFIRPRRERSLTSNKGEPST